MGKRRRKRVRKKRESEQMDRDKRGKRTESAADSVLIRLFSSGEARQYSI